MTSTLKSKESTSLLSRLKNRLGAKAAPGRVYDQAAEKFLSLHEDNVEAEDWLAFQDWVAESERNARVMDRMDSVWRDIKQLHTIPWPSEEECRADSYDGDWPIPLLSKEQSKEQRDFRWAIWLPAAGFVAASLVIAFVGWPLLSGALPMHSTGVDEHRLVNLQDGSEILLGGKTTVRINYTAGLRQIHLDAGEALFTVTKDPERPFVVSSGNANVVAVGTQFNVRKHINDVVVSVVEGVVNVAAGPLERYEPRQLTKLSPDLPAPAADDSPRPKATTLTIGQQIKMSDQLILSEVRTVSGDDILSWREGRLVYTGDPLSAVISDVNRYHNRPVRIVDDELEQLLFSGTVHKNEIDDWLNGLQTVFNLKVVINDQAILIMAKERP